MVVGHRQDGAGVRQTAPGAWVRFPTKGVPTERTPAHHSPGVEGAQCGLPVCRAERPRKAAKLPAWRGLVQAVPGLGGSSAQLRGFTRG